MKRLLIIVFCLPLIGLGQITVTEVTTAQKKENNARLFYSFKSGLGIDVHKFEYPGRSYSINSIAFLSYYLIPAVNYNIPLNNKFGIYNNVGLPIKLQFPKTIQYELVSGPDTDKLITQNSSYETKLIIRLEYNVGVQAEMYEGLQSRLGMTLPRIGYESIPGAFSYLEWGGGFHIEFDYSLTNNLSASLSVSRELFILFDTLKYNASNSWETEILIGVNYKL